jgi:tRNA (mo5U34)-methyltransferase
MIDTVALRLCLDELGLGAWRAAIEPALGERLSATAHGDMDRWLGVLARLPATDPATSRALLLELAPWRKGPFRLGGVDIDAEWRSDLKWDRLRDAIAPLAGRRVLDVGCGNGYYALRMREAGADCVIGIDPTLLYVVQFLAVSRYTAPGRVFVLPFRLDELPGRAHAFDTTFSMGVLYHRRAPLTHLSQLRETLRPGGQLVLETLFLPGDDAFASTPPGRYARMRNVWLLPTLPELSIWLERTGFRDVRVADRSATTVGEQRSTEWMPFESLAEALDPADPDRTVEGWPAPRRAVVLANTP